MKITDVEAIILEAPEDYIAPRGSEEAPGVKYALLLKVSTDEGMTGWADVETSPHVGTAVLNVPPSGMPGFQGLKSLVLGEDPFEVEKLWRKAYTGMAYFGRRGVAINVLSGFNNACHDIIGKATGQPVYKILGGKVRDSVRAYASTLFRPTTDDMKKACAQYLEYGFTAIKFGWGVFGQDLDRDVALVAAAREAVGPSVDLMVDAGWCSAESPETLRRTAYDAIELIRRIEPYNIFWLEDFLHPDNYDGYRRVRAESRGIRIAAGEQETTAWGFRDLVERGQVDVIQPDLSRCGGLSEMRKIAWEAERAGIEVCPHAWLTDLLTAASLHVNAWLPKSLFLEYNVSTSPMLREIIRNPVELQKDGTMRVPEGPGLGIEIDEKAVERFRVAQY